MDEQKAGKTHQDVSDERLMLAFAHGSQEAFTEPFGRYREPINGFFQRRMGDAARAEELTQDTFAAIVQSARRYQPKALFRTYLYAIALKILRSYHRKVAFRATFFGAPRPRVEPRVAPSLDASLWVREAVSRLDAVDREILLLREFEELSYIEIADVLKLPLNTVRSRLFRARMALRDRLEAPQPAKSSVVGESV
jgi:RNA polymerase sigma-70 factor (ECF subfamily)